MKSRQKWYRDLNPLRSADAEVLRKFAVVMQRKHPGQGLVGEAIAGTIAQIVRDVADRLDAGDLARRPR